MSKNLLNTLNNAEWQFTKLIASVQPGEAYHPEYERFKDVFKLLIKSDVEIERGMRRYFREARDRILSQILWNVYQVRTAAEIDDFIEVDWEGETLDIKATLSDTLIFAIRAGGMFTEFEQDISVDWSEYSNPAAKYLEQHTTYLSKTLTDTTEQRLRQTLRESLSLNESVKEAQARVRRVIDDPRRAASIAHTESIRAFNNGRIEAGTLMGADGKMWDATIGACHICRPLDGETVKLDGQFNTLIGKVFAPPAHPNCRCHVRLTFPGVPTPSTTNQPVDLDTTAEKVKKYLRSMNFKVSDATKTAAQSYQGAYFDAVNSTLRSGVKPIDQLQDIVKDLDKLLKQNKAQDTFKVYRGLSFTSPLKAGDELTDAAYMSTTVSRKVAEKYAAEAAGKYKYIIEMEVRKGSSGVFLGEVTGSRNYRDEFEWLIPRGNTIIVNSIQEGETWQNVSAAIK